MQGSLSETLGPSNQILVFNVILQRKELEVLGEMAGERTRSNTRWTRVLKKHKVNFSARKQVLKKQAHIDRGVLEELEHQTKQCSGAKAGIIRPKK